MYRSGGEHWLNKAVLQGFVTMPGWLDWEAVAMHVLYHEHATAYRHVKLKFRIEVGSRAFSHQHVRHNVGIEHNQRSQRYVDEEGFDFVVPPSLLDVNDGRPELRENLELFMLSANELYRELREAGIPAGDARYVLPNSCETKLHTSFSLQALRHYCAERLCSAAQSEIREVARQMVKCVRDVNRVGSSRRKRPTLWDTIQKTRSVVRV